MPSPSIASTLLIIFIPYILISFPKANATSSSSLINSVCASAKENQNINYTSCTKLLQSEPRIASAKNLFDLAIGIIKSGISRSMHVKEYVESLLKKNPTNPKLKGAIKDCNLSYDLIIGSMKSALSEVEGREFDVSTYDLLIASTDNVQICEKGVASGGIKDEIILSGNKAVPIYGLSAFEAAAMLENSKTHF